MRFERDIFAGVNIRHHVDTQKDMCKNVGVYVAKMRIMK